MAIHVYMEKITITGWTGGLPTMAVTSSHDITHCLTWVGDIDEHLALNGDFVMPEFEFRLDNIDNADYFPTYPLIHNFLEYYNAHIRGDRVHVDVRYITATNNKSIFYGRLNSTVPAINYDTAEISFTATHIMKSGLTDITMENIVQKNAPLSVSKDLDSTALVRLWDMRPQYFGMRQTAAYKSIDLINTPAMAAGLTITLLAMPVNNIREYRSSMEFLGDFLRAMSCYYIWDDNVFSIYDIKNIWTAQAAVALDDVMTEIKSSEPWEDTADDVIIEAGDNKYSGYDLREDTYYGQRPFTYGSVPSYIRTSQMVRGQANRGSNKVITAPMLNYFFAPSKYCPKDNSGRRPFQSYATGYTSAINFMIEKTWVHNRDFWTKHKVKLDCQAEGLNYQPGRSYTIQTKNYKCVHTSRNLENETTQLKLVSAEL